MREHDALVNSYVHLDKFPRSKDALRSLQKIASLVKPIMRRRGWKVGTLTEFWPDTQNLLGLNINHGQKICLRLRYAGDRSQFMPLEHVVDTMLHELSHNVVGPHNAEFNRLWNELRDEYDDLKLRGYTGEGFLSEGQRVGGKRVPMQEMRRQARAAAERRNAQQRGSGQRLGGRPVPRSANIRDVIADATSRRIKITQGCASGTRDSIQIAEEATRNGFRTQAEEDQANDRAIAEALWELAQEAEGVKDMDDPNTWQTDGLTWDPESGLKQSKPRLNVQSTDSSWLRLSKTESEASPSTPQNPSPAKSKAKQQMYPPEKGGFPSQRPPSLSQHPAFKRPLIRDSQTRTAKDIARRSSAALPLSMQPPDPEAMPPSRLPLNWTCPMCTLSNPPNYLACDACGTENPCQSSIEDWSSLSNVGPVPGAGYSYSSPTTPSARPSPWNTSPANTPTASTPTVSTPTISTARSTRSMSGASRTARSLAAVSGSTLRSSEERIGWNCRKCGNFMENQWWTCSSCGLMKDAS